jgi:phenylpropionate dioxygenase-like ring-hydroxylating dioxygenase large terminal subunit
MAERESASKEPVRWPRYEAADSGFRNYWYPVIESRRLGKKPLPIKLVGEKIALVRDNGKVYAINDRCPHRGVPLSAGRRECAGTISCIYHGWTYDLATGDLVAALTDGPDSPICGKATVRIKTYPVEERAGIVWVYVGDAPPPPVEEDIPEELLTTDARIYPMVDLRKGNWRYAMENAVDEAHAKYLHRRTPFYIFSKFPGSQTDTQLSPSEDGIWLRRDSKPVFESLTYPRIGKWPSQDFWRFVGGPNRKGTSRGAAILGWARLPAIFSVGHGDWCDYQMFTPVDEDHHLMLQVSVKRTGGFGALMWALRYWTYIRYVHHVMLNRWEDGSIVEAMDCPPERLFRPDVAIVAWRRWCEQKARHSPSEAGQSLPGERTAAAQSADIAYAVAD